MNKEKVSFCYFFVFRRYFLLKKRKSESIHSGRFHSFQYCKF